MLWQFRHARPVKASLGTAVSPPCMPAAFLATGLLLRCGPSWHSEHKNGERDLSKGVMLEPCAVWQWLQSSVTGWCSHKKGPRFSAWQAMQDSVTVFLLSRFGPAEPCGL